MADQLRAIVIGASSGVGRAITERLAADGASMVIASRDIHDLETLATHLNLTTGASVRPAVYDLSCSPSEADEFCSTCVGHLGTIDAVFLVAAQVSDEDSGLTPGTVAENLIHVTAYAFTLFRCPNFDNSGQFTVLDIIRTDLHSHGNIATTQ